MVAGCRPILSVAGESADGPGCKYSAVWAAIAVHGHARVFTCSEFLPARHQRCDGAERLGVSQSADDKCRRESFCSQLGLDPGFTLQWRRPNAPLDRRKVTVH